MKISEFQQFIEQKYGERDRHRGTAATFMWFVEEVSELATALSGDDRDNKVEEFADVFAWLCTLANINDIDIEKACDKYIKGNITGYK